MELKNRNSSVPLGVFLVVAFLTLGSLLIGLKPEPSPAQPAPPMAQVEVAPNEVGSGVYVFSITGDAYIKSLAKFYKLFPNRHCDLQGFTEKISNPGENYSLTETTGFILHCHDIMEAQAITIP